MCPSQSLLGCSCHSHARHVAQRRLTAVCRSNATAYFLCLLALMSALSSVSGDSVRLCFPDPLLSRGCMSTKKKVWIQICIRNIYTQNPAKVSKWLECIATRGTTTTQTDATASQWQEWQQKCSQNNITSCKTNPCLFCFISYLSTVVNNVSNIFNFNITHFLTLKLP